MVPLIRTGTVDVPRVAQPHPRSSLLLSASLISFPVAALASGHTLRQSTPRDQVSRVQLALGTPIQPSSLSPRTSLGIAACPYLTPTFELLSTDVIQAHGSLPHSEHCPLPRGKIGATPSRSFCPIELYPSPFSFPNTAKLSSSGPESHVFGPPLLAGRLCYLSHHLGKRAKENKVFHDAWGCLGLKIDIYPNYSVHYQIR